jgi:hypothetical protein
VPLSLLVSWNDSSQPDTAAPVTGFNVSCGTPATLLVQVRVRTHVSFCCCVAS